MPSPPLVIAGAAQIRLLWDVGTEGAVNVLGAQVTGGVTFNQALADAIGQTIKGAFTAQLGALMATSTHLVHVGVRDLRTPNQPEFLDSGATVAGTGTGDPMPASVAICVTLRTPKAGKSFRGRVYLSGWTEAENDANGQAAAAANTAAASFMNVIATGIPTSGLNLAVLSRPSFASVTTRTTTFADGSTQVETIGRRNALTGSVTGVSSTETRTAGWETQRRRINGRGATFSASGLQAKFNVPQLP